MKKPGNKKLLKSNRISGFQKADHQKLPIDKTRRIISQKFHFFKIFKVGLIGALIFGILFELALEHVPGLLLWSIYGIIVTVILKEIWDIVKERYKSTDEYKNMMSSSQSPWQKTVIVFGCLFDIVLQSGEVFFGAILMLSVTGGAVWASVHGNARTAAAVKAFIAYGPADEAAQMEEKKTDIDVEETIVDKTVVSSDDKYSNVESSRTLEPQDIRDELSMEVYSVKNSDYSLMDETAVKAEQIEKARRMRLEIPTKDWSISAEDRAKFLFMTGEYAISTNWTAEQAAVKLKADIEAVIACQYLNDFDIRADQSLRNLVSEASAQDNTLVSSREKDHIITVRLDAYTIYGKASLARLLAEDFHCYALAYQYYNGDRDIITSYYLQSVKWLFESLKYAKNSPESQINILVSLRYRYNDIMTYSEPKSEQWERAKLLSDALDEIIEERK